MPEIESLPAAQKPLADLADKILRDGLPAEMKETIAQMLASGVKPRAIKNVCRRSIRRNTPVIHSLTELAMEAEVNHQVAELKKGPQ